VCRDLRIPIAFVFGVCASAGHTTDKRHCSVKTLVEDSFHVNGHAWVVWERKRQAPLSVLAVPLLDNLRSDRPPGLPAGTDGNY
jgi:hypothetical protein